MSTNQNKTNSLYTFVNGVFSMGRDSAVYDFTKKKAQASFMNTASMDDIDIGTVSSGVSYRGVSTALDSPFPSNRLINTRNLKAYKSELTSGAVSNIAARNNRIVNAQFDKAMNATVPVAKLPTPVNTGSTTVSGPTPKSPPRRTVRRLYNPKV